MIKTFFYFSMSVILFCLYLSVRGIGNTGREENKQPAFTSANKQMSDPRSSVKVETIEGITTMKTEKMKYILRWSSGNQVPFTDMGKGQDGFIKRNCPYTNCFVSDDRNLLGDYTKFDVIAFLGTQVLNMPKIQLPQKRSATQKYVFGTIESSDNYPVRSNVFNGFFNWTWTYKLDSDSRWGYVVVRDSKGQVIGPNIEMHWIPLEDMDPVEDELKNILRRKTKAAAWFVSNCRSKSHREVFVGNLKKELKKKYPGLDVDVYGKCGTLKCSRDNEENCDKMIERDYYFYLSFENSFSEDYVTEKLLHAVRFNVIPIVYGGANYSRFLPDHSYLNARELGVERLAAKMNQLIQDPEKYSEYFRWKRHYNYHGRSATIETNDYCAFCALLNNKELMKKTTVYDNFRQWWNPHSFSQH